MRKAFLIGSLTALVGILAGCGGGGGGTRLNSSSKIVVGYVYVSTNNVPAGSPDTLVTNAATAPDGYAAPTAGTFTLHVNNGTITRSSADESFDMSIDGNAIVARVTSQSSTTPTLEFSGTGFQYNGVPKANIPTQSLAMTGANDITMILTYLSPSYTPGAPAAIKVLVLDPNGADKFGAPADVIPSIIPSTFHPADDYQMAVIALDANNVVIPGTTPVVTDPDGNSTELAVSEGGGLITVVGGGVEGTSVAITAGVTVAPTITTTFTTIYSYGTAFVAAFSPSGPTVLTWPGAAGPGASQAYTATVTNGRGVPVPNLNVSFTRADTGTASNGTAALDPYPAPATGNAISGADPATDASGQAVVTFNTPDGDVGNVAFNSIAVKGTNHLQIRNGGTGGTVMGSTSVIIDRPLASLTISGPGRLDVGTQSKAFPLPNSYQVTGAIDIDTLAVAAPVGVYTWTITPTGNGGTIFIGDPDNQTLRGVATPSTVGSVTGPTLVIAAGANAGEFTVTATLGVTSNVVTTEVFGTPSKVILSPTPTGTGYHGNAGDPVAITASYEDAWGHDVTLESTTTFKNGSVNSAGASINFPPLPSLLYNAVLPNANGTATATLTLSGSWTGTGQGSTVGTGTFNLTRAVDLVVP